MRHSMGNNKATTLPYEMLIIHIMESWGGDNLFPRGPPLIDFGGKWFKEVDDLEDPVFSDDESEEEEDGDDNDDNDNGEDCDNDEGEDDDDGNGGDMHVDTDAACEMHNKIFNEHEERLSEFERRQKVIEDNQAQLVKGQTTLIKDNKKIKKYVKGLLKFLSCFGDTIEKTKALKKFLEHSDDEDEVEATTGEEATTSHPTPTFPGIGIEDYIIGDDYDDLTGQFLEGGGGGPKIN
ncbi:hypothetical protein LIER_10797 [Lithospermum erythrorhizon]|uniref:Uncharacterized protein n=1 Tax=Lithospermum erythrorhizon TaxID=34254 RepID=A0AAV3PLY3_LITER